MHTTIRMIVLLALLALGYLAYTLYRRREGFKVSNHEYRVQEIDGFLTPEECDRLVSLSSSRLSDSMVYSNRADVLDTKHRISKQAWLKDADDPVVAAISRRVARASGLPLGNQEDLQVVSYGAGGFFKPHYDQCDGDAGFCERMNGGKGPRLWTYLIYLNDGFHGGDTVFPKLGVSIRPKKGKCVVFQNTDENGEILLESYHGGEPVISGNKWVCNKWVRSGSS